MTSEADAFLAQARSDFATFETLLGHEQVPPCHALHFLQMAAEKVAKAAIARGGDPIPHTHAVIGQLPYRIRRRDVAGRLGFESFDAYSAFLRRATRIVALTTLTPAGVGELRQAPSPRRVDPA